MITYFMTNMIEVNNVSVAYTHKKTNFFAVKNISLSIERGKTLGLVGESGCGKTTLGKCITGLIAPQEGQVLFERTPIYDINGKRSKEICKEVQMIFQDPYSSLNPRMTVEEIIREPLEIYRMGTSLQRKEKCLKLLSLVGLDVSFAFRYPHELSGGQRQRVGIARALAPDPKCLVCDEPIAALDVSIQAQIINLLKDLQEELGLTYLFISHDLAIVRYLCTKIAVMYRGNLVEMGYTEEIYQIPKHPYTKALLSAIPSHTLQENELETLSFTV